MSMERRVTLQDHLQHVCSELARHEEPGRLPFLEQYFSASLWGGGTTVLISPLACEAAHARFGTSDAYVIEKVCPRAQSTRTAYVYRSGRAWDFVEDFGV